MKLPLEGIRILDLTRLLPGPYATLILADMGAEVIKIEDPIAGDYARWGPPLVKTMSVYFMALNRNKKSVVIDLKKEKGREVFLRLVRKSDVVIESFRPSVMEKLGIGYETLKKENPSLVMCSITGYGQTGLYREKPGHDINYLALSGFLDCTGVRDGQPVIPGGQVADYSSGLYAVIGILSGIIKKMKTGEGSYIDISMAESAMSFMSTFFIQFLAEGILPTRGKTRLSGEFLCYNIYRTKDGKFMALGALEPKFWEAFVKAIGREDLMGEAYSPAVDGEWGYEELKKEFLSRTQEEWIELLKGVDTCCEPVRNVAEVVKDPHFKERRVFFERDYPGEGRIYQMRTPIVMNGVEAEPYRTHPPKWGEHTKEVLKEIGGYKEDEIELLEKEGIIKTG
jgi:crotonobetainyl-CoA:carnitine CoA-transferase CaiB-like acyl-CoA transferase